LLQLYFGFKIENLKRKSAWKNLPVNLSDLFLDFC